MGIAVHLFPLKMKGPVLRHKATPDWLGAFSERFWPVRFQVNPPVLSLGSTKWSDSGLTWGALGQIQMPRRAG